MRAMLLDPPHAGDRDRLDEERRALVVGGGLAGLAAATVLAERGVAVTVVEREPVLGGRLGAWSETLDGDTDVTMERGFHAFFRHYYNLRGWLQRIDPHLERLVPLTDYPIFAPDGQRASFSDLPTRTPFNFLEVVRRTPSLAVRDLLGVNVRGALEMLRFDHEQTWKRFDQMTAAEYFDGLGFPPDARALLFDVFAHSFFNPESSMSAAELLMMFHFYFFANPEGLVFDVLDRPFDRGLFDPMAAYLETLGVTFSKNTAVDRIERTPDGPHPWRVHTDRGLLAADAVVLAVTVDPLRAIVAASPDLDDDAWRSRIESLDVTLPFAVWRLWLDKAERPGREPFVGTADAGLLDNISLYHQFQDEARDYVAEHGGSVVELHAYAVPADHDEQRVRDALWAGLMHFYPELQGAHVRDSRFLMRRDCPAFERGSWATRPGVETPFDGLVLAGDLTSLPIPSALMERAVTSGLMAANHLLRPWRGRPEPVWSVPTRGALHRMPERLLRYAP